MILYTICILKLYFMDNPYNFKKHKYANCSFLSKTKLQFIVKKYNIIE